MSSSPDRPFQLVASGSTEDFLRDYEDCHETTDDTHESSPPGAVITVDSLIERLSIGDLTGPDQDEVSGVRVSGDGSGAAQNDHGTEDDDEIVQTPPPSPTEKGGARPRRCAVCAMALVLVKSYFELYRLSLFSLAQVSSKLGELWSSARESIFGEDYWIPSDPNEIVFFPQELLRAHEVVYPNDDSSGVIQVVKGSMKNRPGTPLHHVVLKKPDGPAYSIFRTHELDDAVDLCLRCHECQFLFTRLEKKRDARKQIQELIKNMKAYPLWRMLPIAIASNREDVFFAESVRELNAEDANYFKSLCETMAQPEGKYPLHIAIEMHRLKIARRMLEEGCDPAISDLNGNNALHYASLASVQMIELLWEFESSHKLINQTNNEGCAPVTLAIRNANPRCLASLLSYGAEMSIRVAGRNPLFEAMQSKGKNTDIIKAILEASPDLLNERDSLGNTALHAALYKTPLMGLLYLKAKEIDLNTKNYAGQAPLHLYTVRGEIGLIITLASYNCNIDEPDSNGNTALHMAVSKRNTEATRLLLCLGANPNKKNHSGDTPRHLAARVKQYAKQK